MASAAPRPSQTAMPADGSNGWRIPGCSPDAVRTSTTSRAPACCTPASSAAPTRMPDSAASMPRQLLALPGVHAVLTAADLNPEVKEASARGRGQGRSRHPAPAAGRGRGQVRRRSGGPRHRREPLRRRGRARTLSTSTTSRCPPWPTSARHSLPRCRSTRPSSDNNAGGMAGMPPDEEVFGSAAHMVKEHIYQQMACRCRSRRAAWSPNGRQPRAN